MQIKDVTKRRDDEVVIHYIDDDGNYQSLRAYPGEIIAWHSAAQHTLAADGDNMCRAVEHFYVDDVCAGCGRIRPAAKA